MKLLGLPWLRETSFEPTIWKVIGVPNDLAGAVSWFEMLTHTECKESKACAPSKHHFEECVERVTAADEGKPVNKKHPNEDCVEECESVWGLHPRRISFKRCSDLLRSLPPRPLRQPMCCP